MTTSGGSDPGSGAWLRRLASRRTGIVGGAVALAAVVVALVLTGALGSDGDPDPTAAPTPSASSSPTPTAAPSPDPTPTPSAPAPTPTPTDPADPGAAAGDGTGQAPVDVVEPPQVVPELPPVPLSGEADFGTEVAARLTAVARVDGEGQGLGEDSGPALAVTVEMTNGTAAAVDLSFVVVNLADAAGNPGQMLLGDPRSAPFTGALEPGASRTATYVLRLPADDTTDVTVTLSYGAEAPTAVFSGPVPTGSAG